ncbi:MAG: phage tail assembly chaperone [Candidatus Nanopelagicaceae bacterium]
MTEINPDAGSRNWNTLFVVENGEIVKTDNTPLESWVTDSGQRPSDEWLASQGYYGLVLTEPPAVDEREGYAIQSEQSSWEINEESKTVIQGWQIIYYTDEDKATRLEQAWKVFREDRNFRLTGCDWTQVADSPMLGNADWLAYRQSLRDLPSVTVDPYQPQWPIAPQ